MFSVSPSTFGVLASSLTVSREFHPPPGLDINRFNLRRGRRITSHLISLHPSIVEERKRYQRSDKCEARNIGCQQPERIRRIYPIEKKDEHQREERHVRQHGEHCEDRRHRAEVPEQESVLRWREQGDEECEEVEGPERWRVSDGLVFGRDLPEQLA